MFKKISKKLFIVLPTALFLAVYTQIPENVIITKGQTLDFNWGITGNANREDLNNFPCCVKLFDFIPIKTVSVSVTPERYVIPSGHAVGVKLYSDGVLVVGIGEVHDIDGRKQEPAKDAGILAGDRIVAINGEDVNKTTTFSNKLNDCKGSATISIIRDGKLIQKKINAVCSQTDGLFKAGMWVRDSSAGIGTLTFIDPENSTFAALGHAICDSDTKQIIPVSKGSVSLCKVNNVYKSTNGSPGELTGSFSGRILGTIEKNCEMGIYGNTEDSFIAGTPVPVATRFETKKGVAQILCDIDGNGPKPYNIEITKISKSAQNTNKGLVLRITDENLIAKTGGIVQGMSGSPIIQNGRIVGAVTHVFVNDPTRGYGIFIESMLAEASLF